MYKQWEEEPWRIEYADDAKITFTIALHGTHAWEMVLEDSRRYHSISHGWATDDPRDWEDTIAPVLRQFFDKGHSRFYAGPSSCRSRGNRRKSVGKPSMSFSKSVATLAVIAALVKGVVAFEPLESRSNSRRSRRLLPSR